LVSNLKGKEGKVDVKIKGKVTEVCQEMGCWIKVQSTNGDMTVRMKDHKFFVPVILHGKTSLSTERLKKKITSCRIAETFALMQVNQKKRSPRSKNLRRRS
jgi:hypothetical protein